MSLRRPHLARYRTQLRSALLNPSLSKKEQVQIREKLRQLGKPKPYAALARQSADTEDAYGTGLEDRASGAPPHPAKR